MVDPHKVDITHEDEEDKELNEEVTEKFKHLETMFFQFHHVTKVLASGVKNIAIKCLNCSLG